MAKSKHQKHKADTSAAVCEKHNNVDLTPIKNLTSPSKATNLIKR